MSDLPAFTVVQQSQARPKTGEELEVLGKEAASRYLRGGGSLTNSVVETVKKAGLSPEQVRRVVEFANTEAFLREFKKEGAHKVVEFDGGPADVSAILKDLNDGGGGTVFDRGDGDYTSPPSGLAKEASATPEDEAAQEALLSSVFRVGEPGLPYAEPLRDAWDLRLKLAGVYDEVSSELSGLEALHLGVCEDLYGAVKTAALDGVPLGDVVSSWRPVTDDALYVKLAFQMLTPRLLDGGVFERRLQIAESLEKTASRGIPNTEHPIVRHYSDYCDNLRKMAQIRIVCDELASHIDSLNTFLRAAAEKTAGAAETMGAAVRQGLEAVPKVWRSATKATADAAPAVETALGGGRLGRLGAGAVKYSPHIAAGLVAEDAYQRSKYSPMLVAAKNMVLSRVPYTHQNMVRQYQYQMGA